MNTVSFEELLEQKGSFCWKNVGKSMLPLIRENKDVIVIEKCPKSRLKKYDAVLFKRPSAKGKEAYVLHRILKVNSDGTYWIVGDNCAGGETVKEEQILGILTAVVRGGKTVTPDSFLYRIYVHIWCDFYPIRFFILKVIWKLSSVFKYT